MGLKCASVIGLVLLLLSPPSLGQAQAKESRYGQRTCHFGAFPGVEALPFYSSGLRQTVCSALIRPQGEPPSPDGYPLLVLLHGINGSPADWFGAPAIHHKIAALQRQGLLPHAYIVVPAGSNGYWTDSLDGERPWREMVVKELLGVLRDPVRFPRLSTRREHRALSGFSMGGFGALSIALENPHIFGQAIGMSPTDMEIAAKSARPLRVYARVFGAVRQGQRRVSMDYIRSLNPYHQVARARRSAGLAQRYYLLHGSREAAKFSEGTNRLAERMRSQGLTVTHRVVLGGTHSMASTWSTDEMERWLIWLGRIWMHE